LKTSPARLTFAARSARRSSPTSSTRVARSSTIQPARAAEYQHRRRRRISLHKNLPASQARRGRALVVHKSHSHPHSLSKSSLFTLNHRSQAISPNHSFPARSRTTTRFLVLDCTTFNQSSIVKCLRLTSLSCFPVFSLPKLCFYYYAAYHALLHSLPRTRCFQLHSKALPLTCI